MSYTRPFVNYPETPDDSLTALLGLASCTQVRYSSLLTLCDDDGAELDDLTPFIVRDSETSGTSQVSRDCQAECQGRLSFVLNKPLVWGSDRVSYTTLISSPEFTDGAWYGWQQGVYIPTSPGFESLDRGDVWEVTGYDRIYLLQQDANVSLSFAIGSGYPALVETVLKAAGVLAPGGTLSDVCDFPGDWSIKTLPGAVNYPVGSGSSYIQILNEQLKASGARPLFCSQAGRYQIRDADPLASRPLQWEWAGDANPFAPSHFPKAKIILAPHKTSYTGDVWNTTNRWVAVQAGLTFEPILGSGLAQVDNLTAPPTDQVTTRTIRTSTMSLSASGQADLETQLGTIVTDALTGYEAVNLTTCPWPMAWQDDVFSYSHPNLPDTPNRSLIVRSWALPINGQPMTFTTNAIASLV